MIHISFTAEDIKRAAWTFVQAFLAVLIVQAGSIVGGSAPLSKQTVIAAAAAALAAGISAVKNLLLADTSRLK